MYIYFKPEFNEDESKLYYVSGCDDEISMAVIKKERPDYRVFKLDPSTEIKEFTIDVTEVKA